MTSLHVVRPFDLETTGIDPATDRIVTAYVGTLDETGALVEGREWLVKPDGFTIPEGATAVHGITTEHAHAHGRPLDEVLPEIVEALGAGGVIVAGHNLAYDLTMLAHEMDRLGLPDPVGFVSSLTIVDTFVIDKHLDKFRKGKRTLIATAPVYGVTLTDEEAHGAAADAIASGRIAQAMLRRSGLAGQDLNSLQKRSYREQMASFTAFKRRTEPNFTTDLNWPLRESALALTQPLEELTF